MANLVDIDDLPDPELEPVAAAEMYLRLAPIRSWNARASKQLRAYVEKHGRVDTLQGTLALIVSGWEYPDEILDRVPDFGRLHLQFTLPTEVEPGRVKEVLTESMPEYSRDIDESWAAKPVLDEKRCKTWVSDDDLRKTETGKAILALRQPRRTLGAG